MILMSIVKQKLGAFITVKFVLDWLTILILLIIVPILIPVSANLYIQLLHIHAYLKQVMLEPLSQIQHHSHYMLPVAPAYNTVCDT